jgi:uncharacterized DUF497 family protein
MYDNCIDIVWATVNTIHMTRSYSKEGIQFEWDDEKTPSNFEKHGISFEIACEVFFDPFVKTIEMQQTYGETRYVIIGMTTQWQILYVVHTVRDDEVFRLISARRATRNERTHYENY